MLVAAGAAAWPTGDQECSGQRGAIEANPKKHRSQMIVASVPSKWAFSARTGISKVLRPEALYIKSIPIRATTAPADRNSVSFIAAYSLLLRAKFRMNLGASGRSHSSALVVSRQPLVWLPQTPSNGYMGMTDIS